MSLFFGAVAGLGWFFSYALNAPGILYAAVIFSVLMNVASYWYSDKLVLKMSGAVLADPAKHLELHRVVENLAITAGLPKPSVYIIADRSPNAFATGRDSKHAVVAVTRGLLEILNKTELEGVIAHELSHIGNRDMLVSTVVVVLAGFVTLLSDFFIRSAMWGGMRRDRGDGRVQAVLMLFGFVLALLAPLFATLIRLAVSRKREFLADASGALLTRYPEGLASALEKISKAGIPMQRANHATAHLFIANPFGGARSSLTTLFMTHPPVSARIKALLGK